jgi:large conductance mechanosensitive channel
MLKTFKEAMLRSDLITVAGGLLIALAAFTLVQAVVYGLIGPLISLFVGDPVFAANSLRIDSSEFTYGAVIETAIVFGLVLAAVYFLVVKPYQHRKDRQGVAAKTRTCPECTSSISALAKRCPHCTAVVQPNLA